MSSRILITTGTPSGRWLPWFEGALRNAPEGRDLLSPAWPAWLVTMMDARGRTMSPLPQDAQTHLESLIAQDDTFRGGADERAAWLLDEIAGRMPQARLLLFVERPALGLAAALAAGEAVDPAEWLTNWRDAARQLLRQVQRDPARCLLVDAEQAQHEPDGLAAALATRLGISTTIAAIATEPVPEDVLAQALAAMLSFGQGEVQGLFAELQASCAVLSAEDDATLSALAAPIVDGVAVARRLRTLLGAERTARRLDAEHTQARSKASTLQEDIAQLKASLAERDALTAELRAQHQLLVRERDAALATRDQQQVELAQARREVAFSRSDAEILSLQVDQVGEELAHVQQECDRAKRELANAAVTSPWFGLRISDVQLIGERPTPPHCELTFLVRDVAVGSRVVVEATVRLLEHRGHPGLAIFRSTEDVPLFDTWHESGREDGVPYMLLLPSDAHSAHAFDAMGSRDWLLLQVLVARLEAPLRAVRSARWLAVARRLREELLELPRRFRYETVSLLESEPLTLRFDHVHCGARSQERLTLQWRPIGAGAGIALLDDAEHGPPLPSWPEDDAGRRPDRAVLALVSDGPLHAGHAAWYALAPADREFWRALLEALPGALSDARPDLLADAHRLRAQVQAAAQWRPGAAHWLHRTLLGFQARPRTSESQAT